MKEIIVYGTGCKSCNETAEKIAEFANQRGIKINITKEKDIMAIMNAGVMSTPGIAVDGVVAHTGSIPSDEQLAVLFD